MSARDKSQGALLGGSLFVAALSSACCWLPLLAVALGFSAVGVGSVFETYRWPLVALAAGFVAGAFALQLRTRRACRADGCSHPTRSWPLPVAGGVLVVSFAVFPEVLAAARGEAHEAATTADAPSQTRHYAIAGMTCEGCTSLLASTLEDQPEITSAAVVYADAVARVEFVVKMSDEQAQQVMERVSDEWASKYTFTPTRNGR